jgi:hypothetical protein
MRVPTRAEALASVVERIFERSVVSADGCRLWTGPLNHAGYAVVRIPGFSTTGAHRAVYEWVHGEPLPGAMHVEHVCHSSSMDTCTDGRTCLHRRCVEPTHLELVTCAENNRRKIRSEDGMCPNGHERTPENMWVRKDGREQCRACNRDRMRAARLSSA